MSTRGAIARVEGDGWRGVYQHSDSYPTSLGKTIWEKLHNGYNMDIERFLAEAIDQHPGGWSSYPDRCYCHWKGRENDGTMTMTDRDCDPLFIEWVYALSSRGKTMAIFTSNKVTTKPPDHINASHCEASLTRTLNGTIETDPVCWYISQLVVVVKLDGKEPDWEAIEAQDSR